MRSAKSRRVKSMRQTIRVFLGRGILVKIALVIAFVFIVAVIFAPVLTPYNAAERDKENVRQGASWEHILGTDQLGRDLFTRLLYGARISISTGILSSLWAAIIGITAGMIAGYFNGTASAVIMRFTDIMFSIPPLILCMVMAFVLGNSVLSLSFIIGVSMAPNYTRMFYGLILSIRENDYVQAATLIGRSNFAIMFKHLLPNCFASAIVMFTMNLGNAIMLESTMSYLGVGIAPPTPAWGTMTAEGFRYLSSEPRLAILPGLCILLIVVAFNIIGDALRDSLDPKLRGKL